MGQAIERIACARGHRVVAVVDETNSNTITDEALRQADVAIDFSVPAVAVDNYFRCFRVGIPVVSGTTGWLERWEEVAEACRQQDGGFFYASNYSIGVQVFFRMNRWLADTMNRLRSYRVSLEEVHHRHKLDAPSGTAITLAEGILEEHAGYTGWALAAGEPLPEDCLPIAARREAEVPGIHEVTYRSEVDELSIRHAAFSRDGFAEGAVLAAEYMQGKRGVYSMKDLLK